MQLIEMVRIGIGIPLMGINTLDFLSAQLYGCVLMIFTMEHTVSRTLIHRIAVDQITVIVHIVLVGQYNLLEGVQVAFNMNILLHVPNIFTIVQRSRQVAIHAPREKFRTQTPPPAQIVPPASIQRLQALLYAQTVPPESI